MASFLKQQKHIYHRLPLHHIAENFRTILVRTAASEANDSGAKKAKPRRETKEKTVNSLAEKELEFIEQYLPDNIVDLLKTKNSAKKDLTNWELINTFTKGGNSEKSVLVDPETAKRIAKNVLVHTAKGPETVFFDGEAGLNLLALEMAQHNKFSKIQVLEKDASLMDVHLQLPQHVAHKVDVHQQTVSFQQIASLAIMHGYFYPTPVYPLVPYPWNKKYPPYTLVTTSSLGLIKYLTISWLYRSQNPKLSFFKDSRPEFFFLMTMKTFLHINGGVPQLNPLKKPPSPEQLTQIKDSTVPLPKLMVKSTLLFRLLFDCYLVDIIPRRGFLPWRKVPDDVDLKKTIEDINKNLNSLSSHSVKKICKPFEDHLMLVYVRPKPESETGLELSDPANLDYYVDTLARKSSTVTLLPTLETWISGLGLELIHRGYSVFTTVSEMRSEDLLKLYHSLISHPDFENSAFQAGRDTMLKYNNISEGKMDNSAEGFEVAMVRMRNEKKTKKSPKPKS